MFKYRMLRLKIAGSRTINRKALRLVVQLVTIAKDQSWGINMCVGWFPGHVCWDVHMQLSQCLGTQYSLPCIESLISEAGIVFCFFLTFKRYPVL